MSAVVTPDLILYLGSFTTLNKANLAASTVAIKDGAFTAVGYDHEVMALAGPGMKLIDLKGRHALPGLIDNHLHIIRGGLNFKQGADRGPVRGSGALGCACWAA